MDHLGAGARPGLPFAPKKAVNNLQQQQQVPVPPPPQQQQNRPTKSEEFDEPPPPYQPISGSSDVDVPAGAPPVNTSTYPPPSSSQTVDDAAATTYPKEKESYKPEEPTQYGESSSSNPMQRSISAENTVSSPAAEAAPPPPPPPPPPAAETAAPATVETMQPKSMPSETLDETVNSKPLPSFEPNTGPAEVPASIEPVADEPKESGSVARMVAAMQAASLAKQEAPSADEYPTNVKPEGENNTSIVVAKYDYVATQPSDLSFYEGDHITVTKRLDDRQCWWEGEVNGQKGFFPANYTDDLN